MNDNILFPSHIWADSQRLEKKNGRIHAFDLIRNHEFSTTPHGIANRKRFYRLRDTQNGKIHEDSVDQVLDLNAGYLHKIIAEIVQTKSIPGGKDMFKNIHMQQTPFT